MILKHGHICRKTWFWLHFGLKLSIENIAVQATNPWLAAFLTRFTVTDPTSDCVLPSTAMIHSLIWEDVGVQCTCISNRQSVSLPGMVVQISKAPAKLHALKEHRLSLPAVSEEWTYSLLWLVSVAVAEATVSPTLWGSAYMTGMVVTCSKALTKLHRGRHKEHSPGLTSWQCRVRF